MLFKMLVSDVVQDAGVESCIVACVRSHVVACHHGHQYATRMLPRAHPSPPTAKLRAPLGQGEEGRGEDRSTKTNIQMEEVGLVARKLMVCTADTVPFRPNHSIFWVVDSRKF